MKSQHQKILNVMKTDPTRWWLPQDFMRPELGDNFVGYEASARLSELAKEGKLDSQRQGKYMARRLKSDGGYQDIQVNGVTVAKAVHVELDM